MIADGSTERYLSNDALWSTSSEHWPSLHLRRYEHEAVVEEFDTPAAVDQVVVLVVAGSTLIESMENGHWRSAPHVIGNVGVTAPGEVGRLRWRGQDRHHTLHLHMPASLMADAIEDAADCVARERINPSYVAGQDPVVASVMHSLVHAADEGAPDMLAASAANFLARHLLLKDLRNDADPAGDGESLRLRRAEDFMIAHLSNEITLQDLADAAGCTTFQLIRFCKAGWGETPFQRLCRLRMETGQHLLRTTGAGIISIAFDCGYSNPSHFAIAFRRTVGMSPSDYRAG